MKIKLSSLIIFALAIVAVACTSKEKTARNGLKYTVLAEGGEKTSQEGDFLVLNMRYADKATDSVWYDTSGGMPQVIEQRDSLWLAGDKLVQVIFSEMNEGDSVTFDISAKELFENTWNQSLPAGVEPDQIIQFNIGLNKILRQDEYMAWAQEAMDKQRAKMQKEAEAQFEKDKDIIESYLAENNISATPTDSGIYIEMLEEGNGKEANEGDTVRVDYAGYLLSGEFFDTSIPEVAKENNAFDENRPFPYEPYQFVLGQGMVIKGWDQGVAELQEGDKARLYIPSTLAYGPQQRGAVIKPNSILLFDVELVEVK